MSMLGKAFFLVAVLTNYVDYMKIIIVHGAQSPSALLKQRKRNMVVIGSSNSDTFLRIKRLPVRGENIICNMNPIANVPGGKGCNQAIALSRLLKPSVAVDDDKNSVVVNKISFVGRLGNDEMGRKIVNVMMENNVNVLHCHYNENYSTGQGFVFQEEETGEVSAIVCGGSNMNGWEDDFNADAFFDDEKEDVTTSILLLQREIPDWVNLRVIDAAKKRSVVIIQDLGGQDLPLAKEYISKCDYLIPNETELQRLVSTFSIDYNNGNDENNDKIVKAARFLQKETGANNIIVTLGSKGCVYIGSDDDGRVLHVPSCRLPSTLTVIDETGAGDAFRAAFALALTESNSCSGSKIIPTTCLLDALRFASAAGALAVTKQGAVPSLPSRQEVEWLLSQQQDYKSINNKLESTRGGADKSSKNNNNDDDEFPFLIGSRMNSMKDRLDLWSNNNKKNGIKDHIERQSKIKGLGCVDFNYPQHFQEAGMTPQEAKEELRKYNLKAGAVCLRYPNDLFVQGAMTHPDAETRKKAIKLTKEAADVARILNCNEVIVWSAYDGYDYPFQLDYSTKFQQIVDAFQECCDEYPDILFSLEYKPTDENTRFFVVPSTGAAMLLVDKINRDNMGLTLDFGHCLMSGENPAQSIALVGNYKKLFGVQLNDGYTRLAAEDGLMFGTIHPYLALEFMYYLYISGYKGHLYFDTFPQRTDPIREAEYNIRQVQMFWNAAKKLKEMNISQDTSRHDALEVLRKMDIALSWARNQQQDKICHGITSLL